MTTVSSPQGHSSVVKLQLLANGRTIPVAQLGPDYIIVAEPTTLPAGPATLRMSVDARSFTWSVDLPDGLSPESGHTRIAETESAVRV